MVKAVRSLGNLVLAVVLIVLIACVLVVVYAQVASGAWERYGLDYGVTSGAWLWLDGEPIFYRLEGPEDGPWVVLVHGRYSEGSETWQDSFDYLVRSGLRVLAVDQAGFGHSYRDVSLTHTVRNQADLLARALNELRVLDATVVGHGEGCAIALQLVQDQPQFVERLLLISPIVGQTPERWWQWVIDTPYINRAAVWARYAGGPLQRWERRRAFYDANALSTERSKALQASTHIVGTTDALLAVYATPVEGDLIVAEAAIHLPVLILVGQEASLSQIEQAETLQQRLENATLDIVPEAGHYVQLEQPQTVGRYIADFGLRGIR